VRRPDVAVPTRAAATGANPSPVEPSMFRDPSTSPPGAGSATGPMPVVRARRGGPPLPVGAPSGAVTVRVADLERVRGERVVPEVVPRPRRDRTASRPVVAVGTTVVLAAAAMAYVTADIADVAPGVLTAASGPGEPAARPEPVVAVPPVPDATVLVAGTEGPALSPSAVAQRLGPALADPRLGSVTASVVDVGTGEVLVDSGADQAREPASTTKVLMAAAALQVLGADRTFPTTTALLPGAAAAVPTVVLVGGGDVLLAAGPGVPAGASAVGHAGLGDLAAATAAALPPGTVSVDVVVDDSLLGGPQSLARTAGDQPFYSPPASLGIEAGYRGEGAPRDPAPASSAGAAFAEGLRAAGVAVGSIVVTTAPVEGATALAEVRSAPLSDVLAYALNSSDNTVSDAVAGLVARELGGGPGLPEAGRLMVDTVAGMGIDTRGTTIADGSGLSAGSVVPAEVLSSVLQVSAMSDNPDLRLLPRLLPVAALSGTLSERFGAGSAAAGVGLVRAKTGSLSGTRTLAGYTTTLDGRTVAFSIMTVIPPGTGPQAEAAIDAVTAALTSCGCAAAPG
jgi:D-alanyl-D-alanine carboxypeptidase/D-alanyl-D-alanine-endopeptidase (penicillin-binding protein 4)